MKSGSKAARKSLKDTGDEAERVAKDMEARGKQAALFFSKLRNEALGLLAVFTAGVGIKEFTTDTINSAANLGMMAKNLKTSTQELSAWQRANERAGGSAEGMVNQLKESNDEIAKRNRGIGSESAQWFYRYGGDPAAMRDGNTFLLARSKIISDLYKKSPSDAMFAAKNMGIGEDTFNLIKQGPDAVLALVEAQKKNSAVTEEQSKAALELRNRWLDLRDRLTYTATTILIKLMPTFEKLINRMIKLADWVADHKDDIKKWIDTAITSIAEFVKEVDAAADSVGGWKNILIALLALKVVSMVGPLLSMAAALTSVATGLGAIGLAGPAALAVIAGLAGYGIGSVINDHLSDGTKDAIGMLIARTLASFGNKEAGESIRLNTGRDDYGTGAKNIAPTAAQKYQSEALFKKLESDYGLPAGTLDSMWLQESSRGKNMLSPKGAKGHFGFMDATAKQYGLKNPNDLAESADAAAQMMSDLLAQNYGDLPKALAAYNWGQGNLNKKGLGAAPLETQRYISQVTSRINQGQSGGSTTNNETNINGPINIVTQATDADGIAKSMSKSLGKMTIASQANYGLQ